MQLFKLHNNPTQLVHYQEQPNPNKVPSHIEEALKLSKELQVRVPEWEPFFLEETEYITDYSLNVVNGRWKEGERTLLNNPDELQLKDVIMYALNVIKGKWPEAEKYLLKSPRKSAWYAKDVLRARWPEAEDVIIQNGPGAALYAMYVLKHRWPDAEPAIRAGDQMNNSWARYQDTFLDGRNRAND